MEKHFVRIIDEEGYFIEDAFVESVTDADGNHIPAYIETPCPDGFYHPRWDGEKWVEGGQAPTPEPQPPTSEERIAALEAGVLALMEVI